MTESFRTARIEAGATRLIEIISATGTGIVVLFGCHSRVQYRRSHEPENSHHKVG